MITVAFSHIVKYAQFVSEATDLILNSEKLDRVDKNVFSLATITLTSKLEELSHKKVTDGKVEVELSLWRLLDDYFSYVTDLITNNHTAEEVGSDISSLGVHVSLMFILNGLNPEEEEENEL